MAETVLLYTSDSYGSVPAMTFGYPLDAFGQEIQISAMQNLGMKYDPHYSLFLAGSSGKPQKVKSKNTLRSLGAEEGMILYVLLVDPITGQQQTSSISPSLPKLSNQRTTNATSQQAPSYSPSMPPISMNNNIAKQFVSSPVKQPPSLLSIAQQKNNQQNNSHTPRENSSFPPLNKTDNYQRTSFPPLAPKNNSPRLVDTARSNFSSKSGRVQIPNELQPFLCSLLDFEVSKKNGSTLFAQERSTGIPYIIKKLNGPIEPDKFFKEFISVFNAENGAILHLYGFIPSPYSLIYESKTNGTLEDMLEAERMSKAPSSWNATTKTLVLFGIAEGMRQLHSKRIMHRNLKPSNIILDNNYYPFIADAGFTREYNRNPTYMAPEMLSGNTYKSKVDIYAYGMIAYRVVTMRSPFDSNLTYAQIKQKVVNGERPDIPSTVPENYVSLFSHCWAQESTSRTSFPKIVEGFVKGSFVLPDADKSVIYKYQRIVVPQYEPKEYSMAAELKKESDEGIAESTYNFAQYLMYGYGVVKNVKEARKYLKISADRGFAQAQYEHARCLMRFEKDDEQANEYLKKAAQNGNRYAKRYLTTMASANTANQPRQVLEKKAIKGDPDALYELGDQMSKSPDNQANANETFEYFKTAADMGNAKAQLRVALSYHNGLNGAPKDLTEANKYYKMAALQGNPKAMCNLAYNLMHGEGIEKDIKTANELYRRSAESGYAVAEHNYAYNLMNGIGVQTNMQEANRLYKLAADQGHVPAQYSFANNLMKGKGIQQDVQLANTYLIKAAENGNILAQCQLAMNYMNGNGVEKDEKLANQYYKMAADQGNPRAQCNYAFALQKGNGIEQNLELANKYYKMAAEHNYVIAQCNYAYNLENGIGIEKNLEEANKYYKLAADQGNSNAQYSIAMNLLKGNGIEKDINAANRYLKLSSDQDNPKAQYQYALNLFKGNGVMKNPTAANELFIKSADAGNPNAQFYIGYNLFNGLGIEKSAVRANHYYKMAADQGNANAQCNLACSYLNGIGVDKNIDLSNKYYKKAADAGNSVAQYNYGMHLLNGVGLPKDIKTAVAYLKQATDAGNPSAMYFLALCYENGTGVEKNKTMYVELIKKSAAAGNKNAKARLTQIK